MRSALFVDCIRCHGYISLNMFSGCQHCIIKPLIIMFKIVFLDSYAATWPDPLGAKGAACKTSALLTPMEWDHIPSPLTITPLTSHHNIFPCSPVCCRGAWEQDYTSHCLPVQSTMLASRVNPRLQLHSTDPRVSIHTCWHPPLLVPQSSEKTKIHLYFSSRVVSRINSLWT